MTKRLSAFPLKIIAIMAMLINHIGHTFEIYHYSYPAFFLTEVIGKLTFPIMAYLLVQGFQYSQNRIKYSLRLGLFGLISALPFHCLFMYDQPFYLFNNIFFTLFIGFGLLCCLEKFPAHFFPLVIVAALLTVHSDWNILGVVIIALFYRNRQEERGYVRPILIISLAFLGLAVLTYISERDLYTLISDFSMIGMLLVIPLLDAYNGHRGYSPTWVKWSFYIFYPLHLSLLWLLRFLIWGF